jgi:hypothetical protein
MSDMRGEASGASVVCVGVYERHEIHVIIV